jgi:hypothetical protein
MRLRVTVEMDFEPDYDVSDEEVRGSVAYAVREALHHRELDRYNHPLADKGSLMLALDSGEHKAVTTELVEPRQGIRPEIHHILDCSTVHIARGDRDRLERAAGLTALPVVYGSACRKDGRMEFDPPTLHVLSYREGFLVHCSGDPDLLKAYLETARDQLYTENFIRLMRIAHFHGCTQLRLDADGKEYAGLPTYDWDGENRIDHLGDEMLESFYDMLEQ